MKQLADGRNGLQQIIANDMSDRGLLTRIYKELRKIRQLKANYLVNKWTNKLNRALL